MPAVIPAPQARPPAWSLVDAASAADEDLDGQRWELGFTFSPEACGDAEIVSLDCNPAAIDWDNISRPANVEYTPYVVRAMDRCSTFGFLAQDYEPRARRLLDRCARKQIGHEFWTGEQAQANDWPNRYLASIEADTLTDGPSGLVDVLGCLEQALADCSCGERGMIHATRQVLTHWSAFNLLYVEGGIIRTVNGTIVVADSGYTGEGPNGEQPDITESQWAYATGQVRVRMGAVNVIPERFEDAVDHHQNDVQFVAWRPAAAYWDGCCHFAAEVDLAPCLQGGTS